MDTTTPVSLLYLWPQEIERVKIKATKESGSTHNILLM